ncbi:hypothetical protein CAP38_12035 [Hydrogenophaga sp. IBVHS2]|nr:hypothetical protein CAP38_12035 [Hydrogenophaga sp. IBVHS2]
MELLDRPSAYWTPLTLPVRGVVTAVAPLSRMSMVHEPELQDTVVNCLKKVLSVVVNEVYSKDGSVSVPIVQLVGTVAVMTKAFALVVA